MRLARVVGNVVSTIKDDGYNGYKLMLVEYFDPETRKPNGPRMIAFDCADAGVGDIVMVNTDGGAGNILLDDNYAIVDLTICGVLDSYSVNGKTVPVVSGRFKDETVNKKSSVKASANAGNKTSDMTKENVKADVALDNRSEKEQPDDTDHLKEEHSETLESVAEPATEKIWLTKDSFPNEPKEELPWPPFPHEPGQEKIWLTEESFKDEPIRKRSEIIRDDKDQLTWTWSAFEPEGGTDV